MYPRATERRAEMLRSGSSIWQRRLAFWGLPVLLAALLTTGGVLAAGLEVSRRYAHALAYPGCGGPQRSQKHGQSPPGEPAPNGGGIARNSSRTISCFGAHR